MQGMQETLASQQIRERTLGQRWSEGKMRRLFEEGRQEGAGMSLPRRLSSHALQEFQLRSA